jgi:asparagine synthase (glutamine-hydrolysing)
LDQIRLIELTERLPNYQLARVDRLTMAHGLEARVPFLTSAVIDASLTYPTGALMAGPRAKRPLLDAVRGVVPAPVWNRPKMKFSAPAVEWLAAPGTQRLVKELLLGSGYHNMLGLAKSGLESVVADLTGDGEKAAMTVWGLLTLLMWVDVHIAGARS